KVIPGSVDAHPTELALVVNYVVQSAGEGGQSAFGDKKAMQRLIRVKSLGGDTDLSALAQEIISKCKLIPASRLQQVEQQLYCLQRRVISESAGDIGRSRRQQIEESQRWDSEQPQAADVDEPVSMDAVDQYIELLYEEIPDKIRGTRCILNLTRVPENMEALVENEALMSALSRVLREDGKRSMELVTNIIHTFFCFSNYSDFHPYITTNKVGDMCLKIIEQEIARHALWNDDLEQFRAKADQNPGNKEYAREVDHETQRMQKMLQKQDRLLFVTFHLLLNLAEDLMIEVKMVKRKIVDTLVVMLSRDTTELLVLVGTFLKKLSIFRENTDAMVQNPDFLPGLGHALDVGAAAAASPLVSAALRLVINLAHDPQFRDGFVKQGLCARLVDILAANQHRVLCMSALYMLTAEDRTRSLLTYTDLVPLPPTPRPQQPRS
ncbi:MAG: kinesin-associated protein-domain-containing protein, partial [Olpidium bornovanus]